MSSVHNCPICGIDSVTDPRDEERNVSLETLDLRKTVRALLDALHVARVALNDAATTFPPTV